MNKQIENIIYEKYPVTDKERNCRIEREKRNWLRKRLQEWLEKGGSLNSFNG